MKFVRVKNWEKYQHYKNRRPPWIKFYVDLLNPAKEPKYAALSDRAKLTLHHIWLLAGETDNKIPESWINNDRLNMLTKPKADELFDAGFIFLVDATDVASNTTATDASKTLLSESDSVSASASDDEFEKLWGQYPRRIGRKEALRHFRASVKTPDDLEAIKRALANYKTLVVGTEERFIKHGSTWFNNWRDYVEVAVATPPKQEATDGHVRHACVPCTLEEHRDFQPHTEHQCQGGCHCGVCNCAVCVRLTETKTAETA